MTRLYLFLFLIFFSINVTHSQKWWKKALNKVNSTYAVTSAKTKSTIKNNADKTARNIQNRSANLKQDIKYFNKNLEQSRTDLKKRIKQTDLIIKDRIDNFSLQTIEVTNKIYEKYGDVSWDRYELSPFELKSGSLYTNSVIFVTKNFPIYNPETNEVVSLDTAARDIMNDIGPESLRGSDLHNDPLGTTIMLMMDVDYLFEAKLIQNKKTGNWTSIKELAGLTVDERQILESYNRLKDIYEKSDDGNKFADEFTILNNNIKKISNEVNYKRRFDHQIGIEYLEVNSQKYTRPYSNTDFNFHVLLYQPVWFGDSKRKYEGFNITTKTKIFDESNKIITTFDSSIESKGGEYIGTHEDYSNAKLLNLPKGKYYVNIYSGEDLILTRTMIVKDLEVPKKENYNYDVLLLWEYEPVSVLNKNGKPSDAFVRGDEIHIKGELTFQREPLPDEELTINIRFLNTQVRTKNGWYQKNIAHKIPKGLKSRVYKFEDVITTNDVPQRGRYSIDVTYDQGKPNGSQAFVGSKSVIMEMN